jgi:hypothetical protein
VFLNEKSVLKGMVIKGGHTLEIAHGGRRESCAKDAVSRSGLLSVTRPNATPKQDVCAFFFHGPAFLSQVSAISLYLSQVRD